MIETIFLLSIFAEILVTTNGGPGDATTNLAYLVYKTALLDFDVGGGSAGGIVAVDPRQRRRHLPVRTVARRPRLSTQKRPCARKTKRKIAHDRPRLGCRAALSSSRSSG